MEFLGIGYQELLLILVLLLVVVGPERLPAMAYQVGRAVREMQRYARAVRAEFGEEFDYIEEQYRTVRGEIDTTRGALREHQAKFETEMREATASLNDPFKDSQPLQLAASASEPAEDSTPGASAAEAEPAGPVPAADEAATPPPLVF